MSFLTKDELESYLNKLPANTNTNTNKNKDDNNDDAGIHKSFSKLDIVDDTPDTPKPTPQKSFSNNNDGSSLIKQKKKSNYINNNNRSSSNNTHLQKSLSNNQQDATCPSCRKPIYGSVVSAMNTLWHASCFTCYKCNKTMEHEKYYEHKGHPYCYKDYKKLFSLTCDSCKKPINTHAISALGKHYHQDHFCCTVCNKPFSDGQFLIHKDKPYCERDYLRACGKKCFGCRDYIKDEYINALGHEWHKHCFNCTVCKKPFSDGTFRLRDEKPYCAQHCPTNTVPEPRNNIPERTKRQQPFEELKKTKEQQQQKKCHHCNEKIFGPCASALGHYYHVSHFQCVYCHRTLSSRVPAMWQGDDEGELICKQCASKQ